MSLRTLDRRDPPSAAHGAHVAHDTYPANGAGAHAGDENAANTGAANAGAVDTSAVTKSAADMGAFTTVAADQDVGGTKPTGPAALYEACVGYAERIETGRRLLAERGWAVLTDLPFLGRDGRADERVVLDLASAFGVPSARDGGRAVWPVTPATQDGMSPGGTFSVRAGAAGFHTDAQYHEHPEDYVCLLGVRTAGDGGLTRLLSADAAAAAVRRLPDGEALLALLRRPVWRWRTPAEFGAAGAAGSAGSAGATGAHSGGAAAGATEGMAPTAVFPAPGVIRWRGDNLLDDGSPAAGRLIRAAGRIDAAFAAAPGAVEFGLGPGDMLIVDNTRVMHARTDFADPSRLLLRVRLWRQS